ncbi:MAG: prenyltransferase/squalene oxidase repeat-containing protein [bacterium]
MRRIVTAIAMICLASAWAWAGTVAPLARLELGEETRRAASKGLSYLARTQNRDGSWSGGSGLSRNVGVTGLAVMAFMAHGNQPGRGEFGENIDRGLDFLLANVRRDGYITAGGVSRMYEHGFAALAMAQAYGMARRQDLGDKLRQATALIQRAQKRADGGWRYDPSPVGDSDISVTVCQVMALRAARNVGIKVPRKVIDDAVQYVKRSSLADGSFAYMLRSRSSGSYALLSAGLNCLYGAGEYDCPELKRALRRFDEQTPRHISRRGPVSHYYFYAHYYAAQAAFHAGGKYWADYYPAVSKELVQNQAATGSWQSNFGNAYATAMACLVLQMPYNYLPIFRRLGTDAIEAEGGRDAAE